MGRYAENAFHQSCKAADAGRNRACPEILTQIVSARRGLKSLAEKLIHSHAHHCIEGAQNPAEGRRKLRELLTVLECYVE